MRYEYAIDSVQYAGAEAAGARALPAALCPLPAHRRGFTFTEVMFAVILLGIGFIMLAGMFPVAIQQTAQTQQETAGASLAVAAVKQLSQAVTSDTMFQTGGLVGTGASAVYKPPMVLSFRERFVEDPALLPHPYRRTIDTVPGAPPFADPDYNPLWKAVRGDLIFAEDPRYAFVPFYHRVPNQNIAKLIVIAVRNQTDGTYHFERDVLTTEEYQKNGTIDNRSPYATLEPRRLEAIISDGGPDVDLIQIRAPKWLKIKGSANHLECVAEGAFVVIADDAQANLPWTAHDDAGHGNGRLYRIGARRADLDGDSSLPSFSGSQVWELAPGYDLASRMENIPMPNEPNGYLKDPLWARNLRTKNDYKDHDGNAPAVVYVIGRPQQRANDPDAPYAGLAQDMAAYTTYINLK